MKDNLTRLALFCIAVGALAMAVGHWMGQAAKPSTAPVPTATPAPRIDFTIPPATPALEWEIDRGNGPECVTGPVGFGEDAE